MLFFKIGCYYGYKKLINGFEVRSCRTQTKS